MLTLWVSEEADRELAMRGAPGRRDVRTVEAWGGFRRLFPEVPCAGVVSPDPDPDLFARLQALKDQHPDVPLVLVTRRRPSILRRLKDVTVEEVVWIDEMETELWAAVRRADAERQFRRLAGRLAELPRLPSTLTAALVRALRRRPPFTSVQTLAGEVGRDRRTLWHHWRNAVGEEQDLTLKAYLDWVLLLRATVRKTGQQSWRQVAEELGVHARTLRRVARRRFGKSLQQLSSRDPEAVFTAFEEGVMATLLADPDEGEATEG